MRCLIDTNVLVSAFIWPRSTPATAISLAMQYPNTAYLSPHSLAELREVVSRKWPDKVDDLEAFIESLLTSMIITRRSTQHFSEFLAIRDAKDMPILADAIGEGMDIIITGDKDFIEAELSQLTPLTPAEFCEQQFQNS